MKNIKKQEDYIIKGIFLLPILSLILLASFIFVSLFLYFQEFKTEEIQEYKNFIIKNKKDATKEILFNTVQDINHRVVDLNINVKKYIKNRVDEAQTMIQKIIKNNPNKSKKEIKELVKQLLSTIRFNNGMGYYIAYDVKNLKILIHPNINHLPKKALSITKKVNNMIKEKKCGFLTIYFPKPNNPNKSYKKIIYAKYIPSLNWVIGTGEYINDAMENLKKEILEEYNQKTYGKDGYFYIYDLNYKLLANPFRLQDIGKNDENITDSTGLKVIQKLKETAMAYPKGEFVTYYWINPTTHTRELKISYVFYLSKLKWFIGTGLYLNDLQKLIQTRIDRTKEEMKELISSIFIILLIIFVLVSSVTYYLSKKTKYVFELYKNDLENKIEQAVAQNREKDRMLQEQSKLASMGEMIGAIAHQWRQPLNSLGLNIQLLVDDYLDGKIDEEYLEQFESKQMQIIKFMSKTIDDFRNFFKIDKEKERFSVKQAINEVLSIVSAQIKSHNIEIVVNGDDIEINGYKSEFNQVILNLVNNAKDAILEKGIKDGKISITILDDEISIEDNGVEISPDIRDKLFEPYFTTKDAGTGIGLYMSKTIIDRMGAKLYLADRKKFVIKGLK